MQKEEPEHEQGRVTHSTARGTIHNIPGLVKLGGKVATNSPQIPEKTQTLDPQTGLALWKRGEGKSSREWGENAIPRGNQTSMNTYLESGEVKKANGDSMGRELHIRNEHNSGEEVGTLTQGGNTQDPRLDPGKGRTQIGGGIDGTEGNTRVL